MRIGVVSDTHGHLTNSLAAVRMLESLEVETVIHCGDIGSPAVPELFQAWPTHFVYGNVDYDAKELEMAVVRAGLFWHGAAGAIELGGRRIAFTHGDNPLLFQQLVTSGEADLVCYGHTHRAEWHDLGPTRVLNPGACYRANPHTVAVVDLPTRLITIVPLH